MNWSNIIRLEMQHIGCAHNESKPIAKENATQKHLDRDKWWNESPNIITDPNVEQPSCRLADQQQMQFFKPNISIDFKDSIELVTEWTSEI